MPVSADTKALLLLTASFQRPGRAERTTPLTPEEWRGLRKSLGGGKLRPADLFSGNRQGNLGNGPDTSLSFERVQGLLERGFDLANALDRWESQGLWVMSYLDDDYPSRIKERLKDRCPPLFFGCGNRALLSSGGLSVVGSRNVSDEDFNFAQEIGRAAAGKGVTIISGGARGVDRAAMRGALEADGSVVGVLADRLSYRSVKHSRYFLEGDTLAFISETSPDTKLGRRVYGYKAMQRNKYIYCLSDAALVVRSDAKGGTWSGANENIKHSWVPLWVYQTRDRQAANAALIGKGGKRLPESETPLDHIHRILPATVPAGQPEGAAPEKQPATTQLSGVAMREAILLLTVHLPDDTDSHKSLNHQEWGKFARWLRRQRRSPIDLLSDRWDEIVQDYPEVKVSPERVKGLLGRQDSLRDAIVRWEEAGVWYITRGDENYPKALKTLLRHECPAILFGRGDKSLLNRGEVAVMGSRRAGEDYVDCSKAFGKAAGEENVILLARGTGVIAESAVAGVLETGGEAVVVLAGNLHKAAQNARFSGAVQKDALVMVSAVSPDAKVSRAGSEDSRWHNDILHGLSKAVLVVRAGRSDEIMLSAKKYIKKYRKGGRIPLWVYQTSDKTAGNEVLIQRGGFPLSGNNPWEQIRQVFEERPDPQGGMFSFDNRDLNFTPQNI